MSDTKDPAIKLFGKTIPVPEMVASSPVHAPLSQFSSPSEDCIESDLSLLPASSVPVIVSSELEQAETDKERLAAGTMTDTNQSSKEDEMEETTKALKKPDKILPCPRCKSMETKFCYYNNYNVNQPRHFCKNCQRYWTAGGSMRNVPVGAGRRKNKVPTSHYRTICLSESLQSCQSEAPDSINQPLSLSSKTIVKFGSESHELVAHTVEESRLLPLNEVGNSNNQSPSVPCNHALGNNVKETVLCDQGIMQSPLVPNGSWPCYYNLDPSSMCPPGLPVRPPFPAFWGCALPPYWNLPWLPQPLLPHQRISCSSISTNVLGKHSRTCDEESGKEDGNVRSLWVPKTLRVDVPMEASIHPLWNALSMNGEGADAVGSGNSAALSASMRAHN